MTMKTQNDQDAEMNENQQPQQPVNQEPGVEENTTQITVDEVPRRDEDDPIDEDMVIDRERDRDRSASPQILKEPVDLTKENVYHVKSWEENTHTYRWKVANASQLRTQKMYSDNFLIGGHPWRILLFPRGNNGDHLSVYLDVADAETLPKDWIRYARFSLCVVNSVDLSKCVEQEAEKRFNAAERDWGFTKFMPLNQVYDAKGGFLADGNIIIEATVEVCKEAYLTNPFNYDSKTETGFVGLKNQGATCYMNSLLQTLYHITFFRKAVYKMPTEDEESPVKSIPLALQRVYYRLQNSLDACDTKELTKSFGWDTIDSFMQHDVQELARVLIDNLEEKMKKTAVEGTMPKLFEGHVKNYLKCLNVPYESSRVESFYDLQLNVKGCKNVYESFAQYCEECILEKDNQYHAEGYGLQDAKKGTIFSKYPPVLMFHLKRFEYDIVRNMMYKVNDRYEFYDEIDLNKYIKGDESTDPRDNIYVLYSVLVHSGDVSGGHYYAYIRPHGNQEWYKFDDDRVYRVKARDAIDENFGGEPDRGRFLWTRQQRGTNAFKRFSNAYMIVYVRKSQLETILGQVKEEDVPSHLKNRFDREKEEEERRRKEKAEAHKFVNLKIATDEDLKKHQGTDLIDFINVEAIKFKKTGTIAELKEYLAEIKGIPADRQRFWKWEGRQNKTYRPDSVIQGAHENTPLEKLFNLVMHSAELNLFLEISNASEGQEPFAPVEKDQDIIMFFKYYDPATKVLEYVGNTIAKTAYTVTELMPIFNQLKGLPLDTVLTGYEEVRPSMIEPVDPKITLRDAELQHGDILAFQAMPIDETLEYPKVSDYYQYLLYRVNIKFYKLDQPKEVAFTMELLRNMTYQDVVTRLAQKLSSEPQFIRITGHNSYGDGPKHTPFKTTEVRTLKEMIVVGPSQTDTLYFEVLDIAITELESKKLILVHWYNQKVEAVKDFKLLLPRDNTVEDLLNAIRKNIDVEETGQIRLMEVYQSKIHKMIPIDEKIEYVPAYQGVYLRAEEVSRDELNKKDKDKTVQIIHFCKDSHGIRSFGAPFFMAIHKGEKLSDVKLRIKTKLAITDEDFDKFKFAAVQAQKPEYMKDDEPVLEALKKAEIYRTEASLGMEHRDSTAATKTASRWYDRPIKIYG